MKPGINSTVYGQCEDSIRNVIAREHGISVSTICLLEPRTIEKTTSGKIARAWCRRAFLNGTLKELHRWEGRVTEADIAPAVEDGDEDIGDKAVSSTNAEVDALLAKESSLGTAITVEELRALSTADIRSRLEQAVVMVSSQGASPLSAPVDKDRSLVVLGLDSMTVVQFKGVLEKRFYCNIPDEFMFTEICSLDGLAEAVKIGQLTESQKTFMENHANSPPNSGHAANGEEGSTTVIQTRREPLCPWFTCCY
jgi:acyl carrier protein